jgi:hypothetical protein
MYIPKNRIKTNLYTNGEEYQDASSLEYIGPYYKLYNGKIFSGKNPNDKPTFELFPFDPPIPQSETPTTLRPGFTGDGPPYPSGFGEDQIKIEDNQVYIFLKEGKVTNKSLNLPYSLYPKPTEDDYKLGVFTRYFCVKSNELIYYELDKKTYDKLVNQDKEWLWELYIPFQIPWTLIGEEKEVCKINTNIIKLQEQRNKRKGLNIFLKGDCTKFWRPSKIEIPTLFFDKKKSSILTSPERNFIFEDYVPPTSPTVVFDPEIYEENFNDPITFGSDCIPYGFSLGLSPSEVPHTVTYETDTDGENMIVLTRAAYIGLNFAFPVTYGKSYVCSWEIVEVSGGYTLEIRKCTDSSIMSLDIKSITDLGYQSTFFTSSDPLNTVVRFKFYAGVAGVNKIKKIRIQELP